MKLGILLDDLGASQLSLNVIKNLNKLTEQNAGIDYIVFYQNDTRPCAPLNFASMQMYEAWGYDGIMVATNLSTAKKMIEFPYAKEKYFYVWDLEWLRMRDRNFDYLSSVYHNKDVELIARSKSHRKLISDCWNRKVLGLVDDFNTEQLLGIINGNSK